MNNAAMNMDEQISLWGLAQNPFEYIPISEMAGSHGSCIFNFLRNHHTVFHFTNNAKSSNFSTSSLTLAIVLYFLNSSLPIRYEVVFHCRFDLQFPKGAVEDLFMCLSAICASALDKCLFKSSCSFLNWVMYFFCCWVLGVHYLFWMLIPYQIYTF